MKWVLAKIKSYFTIDKLSFHIVFCQFSETVILFNNDKYHDLFIKLYWCWKLFSTKHGIHSIALNPTTVIDRFNEHSKCLSVKILWIFIEQYKIITPIDVWVVSDQIQLCAERKAQMKFNAKKNTKKGCAKCAGGHKISDCDPELKKCVNCTYCCKEKIWFCSYLCQKLPCFQPNNWFTICGQSFDIDWMAICNVSLIKVTPLMVLNIESIGGMVNYLHILFVLFLEVKNH